MEPHTWIKSTNPMTSVTSFYRRVFSISWIFQLGLKVSYPLVCIYGLKWVKRLGFRACLVSVGEEISGRVAECTRPKSLDEEGPKRFAC
jgi:hypothetical protein